MSLVYDIAFVFQVNKSANFHCFSCRNCQHKGLECFVQTKLSLMVNQEGIFLFHDGQ